MYSPLWKKLWPKPGASHYRSDTQGSKMQAYNEGWARCVCVCHEVKTFVVVLANYGRMLVTKFAPHFDLWENVPSPPTSLCCNDPCQSSVTFAIKRRFLNACAIYSLAGKFHTPLALRLTLWTTSENDSGERAPSNAVPIRFVKSCFPYNFRND